MVASLLLRRKDAWPSQIISAIALSFSWEGVQTHRTTQFQKPRLPKLPNNCTNSTCPPQMWKVWKSRHPERGSGFSTVRKRPITTYGGYWSLHLSFPGFEGEDAVLAAEAETV